MVDVHTPEQRSFNMSHIRSTKTGPEVKLLTVLRSLGFIYQPKGVYGKPDFANKKQKIAIFIDGCFWHGCPKHYKKPQQNSAFWDKKITANTERDNKVNKTLLNRRWKVLRVWEHNIKKLK